MANCVVINSENLLQVTSDTLETCSDYILLSKQDYTFWFDALTITPTDIGSAISFGIFIVFGMGYLQTYAVGIGLKLIRKI